MKKLLMTLDICGIPYKIFSANQKDVPDLEKDYGITYYDDCEIYIREDTHKGRMQDLIIHEIFHALFEGSGAYFMLKSYLKHDELVNDTEEKMIRMLVPHLVVVLRQIKGLIK